VSVATVKARLALIQAAISGVGRAYAQAPRKLPAADLPVFINFTGAATHDWRIVGSDTDRETRTYLMRLYVAPLPQGAPGGIEEQCEPFFERVWAAFAARPGLEHPESRAHLDGVQSATLLGDGGVIVTGYSGVMYVGIEFRLQVVELKGRSYADYG
jgi:hypothetical protein